MPVRILQVFIGYCDVAAAGLHGLRYFQSLSDAVETLDLVSTTSEIGSSASAASDNSTVLTLSQHAGGAVSVLVISSPLLQPRHQARVAQALLSAIRQSAPDAHICVAAALLLTALPASGQHPYKLMLNGAPPPAALAPLPDLPADLPLRDPTLALFQHFAIATGAPLGVVVIPGHRHDPEAAAELAALLAPCLGVTADKQAIVASLPLAAAEEASGSDQEMLYL